MKAQTATGAERVDEIPVQKLLEGLAKLYPLVLVLDAEGTVVWLSNEMNMLCSRGPHLIGKDARAVLSDSPEFRREFMIRSKLRNDGFLSNMRFSVQETDGGSLPIELSILPIDPDDAHKPLYVAVARPVTETSIGEEHPGSDRQLLAAVLNGTHDAVLVVNEHGFITHANAMLESLVGRAPETLTDRPAALLLHRSGEIERLAASLSPGEGLCNHDLTLLHADGRPVPVTASARALASADGRPLGTVLFVRTVSDHRATVEVLERKNTELQHCVYSLAHDLRSPLVALLGFSRLLRQDYGVQLDETGQHFIDRIEQAGRTMEELIHDLLEFSRIGQGDERRTMADPRIIVLQIAAEMKDRLDAVGARLELPDHPPLIYCDRTRLYQVFSNLIGNAIDHMGPCEDPAISVDVWDDADGHQISVSDHGRGIDELDHERIFEVFQSLQPRAGGHRGSGLGLAIVKKVAETHGGSVWVESASGRGAIFRLTLPRNDLS
ncbi:MAG: PAS domain S-box protein [Deltaproteobacteria bacterium]|nr:PAS domain S-box protein [Deltaproteobacteria bacterium]MBW2399796.1 PAS domain S-box protein [Deltaproteobacteria bacterium]